MRRSFYNALADCLWQFGMRRRAARVVEAGRGFAVYGNESVRFAGDMWSIDLHEHSVGSACAYLYLWLKELRTGWKVRAVVQ